MTSYILHILLKITSFLPPIWSTFDYEASVLSLPYDPCVADPIIIIQSSRIVSSSIEYREKFNRGCVSVSAVIWRRKMITINIDVSSEYNIVTIFDKKWGKKMKKVIERKIRLTFCSKNNIYLNWWRKLV